MISIPTEDAERFRQMAHSYGLKYFIVTPRSEKNKLSDICIKMEDTTVLHRILERCEIGVIKETRTEALDPETAEKIDRMRGKSFLEASSELVVYSQSLDEALDRKTDRNFARDTPYYIAERRHPKNYIKIISTEAEFEGSTYTKSTYSVYVGGEFVKEFDDGRFAGRPQDYWTSVKSAIAEAGGFSYDLVYMGRQEALDAYINLYENGFFTPPEQNRIIDVTQEEIEEAVKEYVTELKEQENIPPSQSQTARESETVSMPGKGRKKSSNENENAVKKAVKENAKQLSASQPAVSAKPKKHKGR